MKCKPKVGEIWQPKCPRDFELYKKDPKVVHGFKMYDKHYIEGPFLIIRSKNGIASILYQNEILHMHISSITFYCSEVFYS